MQHNNQNMLAVTKIQAKQNMEDNDALYKMLLENNTISIFMLPEEWTIMPDQAISWFNSTHLLFTAAQAHL